MTLPEKAKQQKEALQFRKEEAINKMSDEEVLLSLKNLGVPTFGTKQERLDRLKKHNGIAVSDQSKKEGGLKAINKIQQQREERRAEMTKKRQERLDREMENEAMAGWAMLSSRK